MEKIRHSLSHILAHVIQNLYPEVKFGIGPIIENGFYYDFGNIEISEKELPKIEKEMKKLIKKDIEFKKKEISKKEGKELFKNQPYKLELIEELDEVSIYQSGNFIDLCKGPHVKSTKEIPIEGFKLTKLAGAYWRGNERNDMLTRIYGIAFKNKKELEEHLKKLKKAKERDHRLLGKKLGIFVFDEEVGSGLPLWLPKGTVLRKSIEDYLYKELSQNNYQWITTPHIGKLDLWKTSGHWEMYRENIYSPIEIEDEKYLIKPMNCPFHVKIYNSEIRSYRDLPLKYAELGTVYRYEKSGTLHGLTRVRGFTQDDAHIWCTPEQLEEETVKLLKHGVKMLADFGFNDFNIYLSTRPEKYAGQKKDWEKATYILEKVLKELKFKYQIDEGGGVFYGPKIDIKIKDNLDREWQCTTIQIDFNLPERFNINFINKKGDKKRPFMIHRALLGSMERFIGVLLEHYGGALPFWLSPVQIQILPIGEKHYEYGEEILKKLKGLRTELIKKDETISKKIREGEIQKIPYLLIIGDKELKNKTVSVRERSKGDIGQKKVDDFLKIIKI